MNRPRQPLLVAIVGGSGSGKTRLADCLKARLGKMAGRLSLDDFYRDRSHLSPARRARINFDNPAAIDWPAFKRVLNRCLHWQEAKAPRYDFKTHCRLQSTRLLKPKPVMLIDGLWLLRTNRIGKYFSFGVFLNASIGLRLRRRLGRDVTGRGRSRKSVRDQFFKTVQPMHRKFVQPQIHRADLVLKANWSKRQVAEIAALLRQKCEQG